jgi:hypothetical protein
MIAPPPRSNGPCCTVGTHLALNPEDNGRSGMPPHAVWDGARWAVAWTDFQGRQASSLEELDLQQQTVIRFIDDGALGALLRLHRGETTWGIAHTRTPQNSDRYLVASNRWGSAVDLFNRRMKDHTMRIVALDSGGAQTAAGVIDAASSGVSMVRSSALRAWAVASYDLGENIYGSAHLRLLGDDLKPVGDPVNLGQSMWNVPTVHSLEDHVVTVVTAADGVHVRTFVGRNLSEPHPEVVIEVGNLIDPIVGQNPVSHVAAALIRDHVVVAAVNREALRTWTYRPATGSLTAGPNVVAMTISEHSLALAGEDNGGSVGICYAADARYPGQPGGLKFVAVGPDGEPRGQPVDLVPIAPEFPSCNVAAGGLDEYLVTLGGQLAGRDPHVLFATSVRVQRATPPLD